MENWSTRRKTSRSKERTNNKLNPHMTSGPGIEPRPHWWEASALTTTSPLMPIKTFGNHDGSANEKNHLQE